MRLKLFMFFLSVFFFVSPKLRAVEHPSWEDDHSSEEEVEEEVEVEVEVEEEEVLLENRSLPEEQALIHLENIICGTPFYLGQKKGPKEFCDTEIMGKIFRQEIKHEKLAHLNQLIMIALLREDHSLRDFEREDLLQEDEFVSRYYFTEELIEKAQNLILSYQQEHRTLILEIIKEQQALKTKRAEAEAKAFFPQAVIRLSCQHLIHRGCARKLDPKKCPLCMEEFSLKESFYLRPHPCVLEHCPICLSNFWENNPKISQARQKKKRKKDCRDCQKDFATQLEKDSFSEGMESSNKRRRIND